MKESNLYSFANREETSEELKWIEETKTQILTILDAWKDNSSGKMKDELRQAIKQLSNETLPHSQQFQNLQAILTKYPSKNQKLNNWVRKWAEIEEKLLTPVHPWEQFLQENNWLVKEYQEYLNSLKNPNLTINKAMWEKFASADRISSESSKENLLELIDERVKSILGSPQPTADWTKWREISLDFEPFSVQDWKDYGFTYETCKEWIDIGLKVEDSKFAWWLRMETKSTPEEVLNSGKDNMTELRKEFELYLTQEKAQAISRPTATNKYDELLKGLGAEEAERQRKRLEREESKKRLEEEELKRRESKLSEKDRKLKEDVERRQKEKELAEQEEKAREEARLVREQALKEEQETFFATQQKNLEERKKKAEENFQNQQKEAEIAEKKKQTIIDELEKENELQKQKLEKEKELLEKEMEIKLKKIATDDEKGRQEILKQKQLAEARLEEERLENERELIRKKDKREEELKKLKEKNKTELAEAEQELETEKQKYEEERAKIEREEKIRRDKETEERKMDLDRERTRKAEFKRGQIHEKAWNELLNYSLGKSEMEQGVRVDGEKVNYVFRRSSSRGGFINMPTLNEIWNHYPNAKIKLVGVENLTNKLHGDRPMIFEDVKYVARLANRFSEQFFGKDEWKEKINSLNENFFTQDEIDE
ncbi:MAG: hypothetical protein I3274_06280 [Candidatus Moeniiplasma glomeromycotorum]|nr:hypothetical protein [Candidatus Moeniiplasma glomeromycotorum]